MISTKFTYDGISSDFMGIYLVRTSSGMFNVPYVPSRNIREDYPSKAKAPYFFGTQLQNQTITLTFSTLSNTLDSAKLKTIAGWLLQDDYKPFISEDNSDKIYYLISTGEVKVELNANKEGYIEVQYKSKFPYALTAEATPTYNLTNNTSTTTITLNNTSNVYKYYNPIFEFTVSATPTSSSTPTLSIKNLSNNSTILSFKNLLIWETLYVDNNKNIIISSSGNYRYANMSGLWLKLIQGNNDLEISGKGILTFKTQFPVFT